MSLHHCLPLIVLANLRCHREVLESAKCLLAGSRYGWYTIPTYLVFNINQRIMHNIPTKPTSKNQSFPLPTCTILLQAHRIPGTQTPIDSISHLSTFLQPLNLVLQTLQSRNQLSLQRTFLASRCAAWVRGRCGRAVTLSNCNTVGSCHSGISCGCIAVSFVGWELLRDSEYRTFRLTMSFDAVLAFWIEMAVKSCATYGRDIYSTL